MRKEIQKSRFESLLVTHGGDFDSAYADLIDEAGDACVKESLAQGWAKAFGESQRKAESSRQLALALSGERSLGAQVLDFSRLDPDAKQKRFDEEFQNFAFALVTDHEHLIFDPRDRVSGIPKVAELMGTPVRLQAAKRATPQAAHREVEHVSSVFGTLSDRQVLVAYVQEGLDVARAANALKVMDPELSYLTADTLAGKLREWERRGVVMDSAGTVVAWEDAVAGLQLQLRTLPS